MRLYQPMHNAKQKASHSQVAGVFLSEYIDHGVISGCRKSIRKEELAAATHTKTIFHIALAHFSTGFRAAYRTLMCQSCCFLSQADSVSGCALVRNFS